MAYLFTKLHSDTSNYEYIMNIISNHGLAFLLFDTFIHGTDGIYKQTHY